MVRAQSLLAACLALVAVVEAHAPAPQTPQLVARAAKAKRCAAQAGAMKQKRHAHRKREAELRKRATTDVVIHAEAPHYDFITNDTCILSPETYMGPYWYPPSALLRQDMSEAQSGVPLELDIGILDVDTCEPVSNALISLWQCNATGSYSSFNYDPNTPFLELLKEQGINSTEGVENWSFLANGNSTWLRGMWPTDDEGAVAFKSIVPGFYVQRALHIHIQVYTEWNVTMNGTVGGGKIRETGQIFFPEDLSAEIMALEPYASHQEINRTINVEDGIWTQVQESGADSTVDYEPLDGVDIRNGVLAYVTYGIELNKIKNGTTASPTGVAVKDSTST